MTTQQQGIIASDRITKTRSFQVIGTDFAGSIMYRNKNRREEKAYILLFTYGLTRAIHLEILPEQTTYEFIRALKRLISKKGCPRTINSDNSKTYMAACKWVSKTNKSEIPHNLPRNSS